MIIGRKVSNNSVRLQTDGDNKVFSDDNAERKCVVVLLLRKKEYRPGSGSGRLQFRYAIFFFVKRGRQKIQLDLSSGGYFMQFFRGGTDNVDPAALF